jgi:hypothetical protein
VRRSLLGHMAVLGTALLLLIFPEVASSQASSPIQAGSRIRVKPAGPGQEWVMGNLLELPKDSVRLITGGTQKDSVTMPLSSLASFERSIGQRSRAGKGAVIGLGTGAVAGLILGLVAYEECTGFCVVDPGRAGTGAIMALLGGVFGTGLGALFGTTVHEDRWVPVKQPWGSGVGPPVDGTDSLR